MRIVAIASTRRIIPKIPINLIVPILSGKSKKYDHPRDSNKTIVKI